MADAQNPPTTPDTRRVQRSRSKGWRMPEGAIYVGRPSKWGNPFRVGEAYKTVAAGEMICSDASDAVRLYRPLAWCRKDEIVRELRGRTLVCWCRTDRPCHADVLIGIANG